jgi:hypothetical protein
LGGMWLHHPCVLLRPEPSPAYGCSSKGVRPVRCMHVAAVVSNFFSCDGGSILEDSVCKSPDSVADPAEIEMEIGLAKTIVPAILPTNRMAIVRTIVRTIDQAIVQDNSTFTSPSFLDSGITIPVYSRSDTVA